MADQGETAQKASLDLSRSGMGFALVFAAGLSTALGAAAVFERRIVKIASKRILAAGLGFSSGVMLYVSFVEIFVKSQDAFLDDGRKESDAYLCATVCLFAGMVLLRLIQVLVHRLDRNHHCHLDGDCVDEALQTSGTMAPMVSAGEGGASAMDNQGPGPVEQSGIVLSTQVDPEAPNPAQQAPGNAAAPNPKTIAEEDPNRAKALALERKMAAEQNQLQLMGFNSAIAIAIHNFPEGLATFVATLANARVGATLAVAIAMHNIPEGLCVALPIYYATGSRMRGFLWALFSGLSEPVGAFIGWLILNNTGEDMGQLVYGILFGLVAGMMIMIVILELLPTAYKYDPTDRLTTSSVVVGMLVMAASLCLFTYD